MLQVMPGCTFPNLKLAAACVHLNLRITKSQTPNFQSLQQTCNFANINKLAKVAIETKCTNARPDGALLGGTKNRKLCVTVRLEFRALPSRGIRERCT